MAIFSVLFAILSFLLGLLKRCPQWMVWTSDYPYEFTGHMFHYFFKTKKVSAQSYIPHDVHCMIYWSSVCFRLLLPFRTSKWITPRFPLFTWKNVIEVTATLAFFDELNFGFGLGYSLRIASIKSCPNIEIVWSLPASKFLHIPLTEECTNPCVYVCN